MKHMLGNTPRCYECKYYTEDIDEKLRFNKTGWCTNPKELAIGVNGRRRKDPPKHEQVQDSDTACKFWIDAESGHTRFEVETRCRESDGTRIDFSEELQRQKTERRIRDENLHCGQDHR